MKSFSKAAKKKEPNNIVVNVGDIGYKFRKEFDSGWFTGTVKHIRPLAEGGKDRRCVYDDGDSEDLSLIELQTLAILDPNVTKQKPAIGVSTSSSSSKGGKQNTPMQQNQSSTDEEINLPLPKNGTMYTKAEAANILLSFPKYSHERTLAISSMHNKGYIPLSKRFIYKFVANVERGETFKHSDRWIVHGEYRPPKLQSLTAVNDSDNDDDNVHADNSGIDCGVWEQRFAELKQYKKKFGDTRILKNYHNRKLFNWVKNQKLYHNRLIEGHDRAYITPEKIDLLKSIGFVFHSNTRERPVANNHHGVKSDEAVTSKARGVKSDDTVTSKALTHKIKKRRRNDEEEVTELSQTRSKRTVKQPPKVDEIYSYEHMKFIYQRNKNKEAKDAKRDNDAKEAKENAKKVRIDPPRKSHVKKSSMNPPTPPTPDRNLLSLLDYDIPVDAAAVSTLIFTDSTKHTVDMRYDSEDDEKEWLEKVAASLGADTSAPRQKRMSPTHAPILKQSSSTPTPNPQSCIMKSGAASTCSTISFTSIQKMGLNEGEMIQPPESLLITNVPSVSYSLLSEYSVGSRDGRFVIHKNDKRRRIGEVLLENGEHWVEVSIGCALKKYHVKHLVVVPSKHSKVTGLPIFDVLCTSSLTSSSSKKLHFKPSSTEKRTPLIEKNTPPLIEINAPSSVEQLHPLLISDSEKSNENVLMPIEKKSVSISADHLFCWFCDSCDANNEVGSSSCRECNASKTDKSKRSVLFDIAAAAVTDEARRTVDEAMNCIPYKDRASIPKKLIAYLLEVKSRGASTTGFSIASLKPKVETYFYWMCGNCTIQNSYKRSTCSTCLQGKTGLSDLSPLLKIAEDAAAVSQTSDEALLLVPPHERMLIPKLVMDVLVTCVFILKDRHGQQRRCRKSKKDGFDYCVAHCEPVLQFRPRRDEVKSLSTKNEIIPRVAAITMVNEVMPTKLVSIQPLQVNDLGWTMNSVEDSILCGENTAFPLGMTVRKFFSNYGFHDGRIIKVVRKMWAEKGLPILVYRCMYNDSDEEDFLHHEIVSLNQFYDKRYVSPEAPVHEQIPLGAIFVTRSGHTVEIIGHRTPTGGCKNEGGLVTVKFCHSSKIIEFDLLELQKAVLRRVSRVAPRAINNSSIDGTKRDDGEDDEEEGDWNDQSKMSQAFTCSGNPRGVSLRPSGKWQVQIHFAGSPRYIGMFNSREEACMGYEIALECTKAFKDVTYSDSNELQGNLDHIRKSAMSGVTDTCKHNHRSMSNGSTDQTKTRVVAEKDGTVKTSRVELSTALNDGTPMTPRVELSTAPVLEWPMRCQQSKCEGESGMPSNEQQKIEISRGFVLHQRRHYASSVDQVLKFAASGNVNNPYDIRPGVTSERGMMWDPASCYEYLVYDPYSVVVCEICAVNKDDNQVVICDECHKGFHTYCLRPVMVNIPRGDWWCSACSGRTNDQISYEEFKTNLSSCNTRDILRFLCLPFDNPVEFFSRHGEAMALFTLNSDTAVKQHAISHDVLTKSVVFGVDNIMFIRKPEKNDWRLPTPPLSEEVYRLSTLSMAASMKYCGMESNLLELVYAEPANEGMNDPTLEVDTVAPMSKRNLEIYRAFLYNIRRGVLPPVEIIHDENFGFSVKSLGFMRKHTLISAYLGEVVTMEQSGLSSSDSLIVLLDTGNPQTSLIIDPTRAGNIARFLSGINNRNMLSRRKCNVRTRRFEMDGRMHVCLFTCRSVEAGEILNYDYNAGNVGKDIGQWTKTGFYDTSNFF